MKKTDPLTVEEMREAADVFFPLFKIVHGDMPKDSTTEDCLKVMESVAKLGHKLRADKKDEEKKERIGFNKEKEDGESDD